LKFHTALRPSLWLAALLLTVATANAAQAPIAMLEQASERMIDALKSESQAFQAEPSRLFDLVERELLPYVDEEAMARMVLGAHWRKATPTQQRRFVEEFRTFLIRFYVSALLDDPDRIDQMLANSENLIRFIPTPGEDDGKRARVRAEVTPTSGPRIPVSFSLFRKDDAWKVYDVNVDGISIVITYRNNFAQQIARMGLDGLIADMAQRNQRLWQEAKAEQS
jgi:phospholipid transport system substrate-binding protein